MSEPNNNPDQLFNQFITAIRNGSFELVQSILRDNDPVQLVNRIEVQFRQPSLYFAVLAPGDQESVQMIQLLVRNGANINYKDHNQQTIIFYVCREGKQKCLELLMSHGLNLDETDIYGQSPMFYAVSQNRLEIVNTYATKERVNHVDKLAAQSPIYYAARKGLLSMAQLLLQKGADLTIFDSYNKSAAEYAKKAKFLELGEYLAGELRKIRDINKVPSSEEPERKAVRKGKEQVNKDPRQIYKIVFCNDKGEPHDLSEQEVKALLSDKPQLSAFLQNPESIPAESLTSAEGDTWFNAATKIFNQCSKLKGAYYFHEPVDPVKFNIMDYFDIVTQPMDLGTIRRKLSHNCYKRPEQFITDMNLVWQNSYRYNGENHVVSRCGKELQAAFNELVSSEGFSKHLQTE